VAQLAVLAAIEEAPMDRKQSLRISSLARGVLIAALLGGCGAGSIGAGTPAPDPTGSDVATGPSTGALLTDGPLTLFYANARQGISAIWVDGSQHLELQAFLDTKGIVQSTITEHGQVVTRLALPFAKTGELATKVGPLALGASKDQALIPTDQAGKDHLRQLLPVYAKALTALYRVTDNLGDSSLHMALPWNEEVLARLVVGTVSGIDAESPCPDQGIVHTNLMHAPQLTDLTATVQIESTGHSGATAAPACNLGCSWYDVCCLHDQACAWCDHWYCGWCCVPGCFGGECGCGR
jgi:hypothetical protein